MAASPGGVEVGRVSVRVVPDTARFGADLSTALRRIEATTELKVNATIDNARLDEEARAAVAQAELAAGNIHIKTEVDTSQVREGESALSKASSAAEKFSGSISGIVAAVLILGPALIPVIAAVGALGAALVAPLAIAGGALTVFGFMSAFTITETAKQLKAITAAQTKLDGLTKGTKEYAAAAADLAAKQAALTPAQRAFQEALNTLKAAFDKVPKAIVLGPITEGIKLLARILPLAVPILKVVSRVLGSFTKQFEDFAKSPGFKAFVVTIAHNLGRDLRAFGNIAKNVFSGVFRLFAAFSQGISKPGAFGSSGFGLSGGLLKQLENATAQFATFGQTLGQSKGFKSFVEYLKQVTPKVGAALGSIAGAAIAIVTAFAPYGTAVLGVIKKLADGISNIPPGVLAGLAGAIVALAAGSKLLGPVVTLFEIIGAIAGGGEVAAVVAAVVALAAGFVALYTQSKPLQKIIGDLGDFFKTQLLPVIKDAAKKVLPALKDAFHDISKSIKENKPFLEVLGKLLLVLGSAVVVAGIYALVAAIRILGKWIAATIRFWHLLADAILIMARDAIDGLQLFLQGVLFVFGAIVDAAASAFGWLPGIGPKVRAAQDKFHTFADNVINDLAKTSAKLKAIQDQIDGLHGKTLTITVIAKEQGLDRATGPGGGIGRPGQSNPDASSTRTGSSKSQVTINHATFTSTDDVLRKSQNVLRSRAGGGIVLAGGNR